MEHAGTRLDEVEHIARDLRVRGVDVLVLVRARARAHRAGREVVGGIELRLCEIDLLAEEIGFHIRSVVSLIRARGVHAIVTTARGVCCIHMVPLLPAAACTPRSERRGFAAGQLARRVDAPC